MLALGEHEARRWEPKRLRYRLFNVPAVLARTGRRVLLHLAAKSPWTQLVDIAVARLTLSPSGRSPRQIRAVTFRSPNPRHGRSSS